LLGQLAPGDTVRFQEMDIPAAVGLLRQVEAAVDWVRARWAD
jgi:allophanate hydrolase subunit 2